MTGSLQSANTVYHAPLVARSHRQQLNQHPAVTLWFTGLSGAGKSTLAHAVEERLHRAACRTYVLDGDNVRHGLCGDLGFSPGDRHENLRRIGEVAKLMVDAGLVVLAAFISPMRTDRDAVRQLLGNDFIEIYCGCPLHVCESRAVKGMYARAGEIAQFTGISAPYEPPGTPELLLDTAGTTIDECVNTVLDFLCQRFNFAIPPDAERDHAARAACAAT